MSCLVAVFACKDSLVPTAPQVLLSTDSVSPELAEDIASYHYITELHPAKNTPSGKQAASQLDTTFVMKNKKGTPLLYFFRYKENKGWNIIAGDKRFFPVLAYADKGFANLDTTANKGLKHWVNLVANAQEDMDKKDLKQSKDIAQEWEKHLKKGARVGVQDPGGPGGDGAGNGCAGYDRSWTGPDGNGFTGLQWSQTAGFNHYLPIDLCDPRYGYCDKYPAGCGPVAMAMIMTHYGKPTQVTVNGITTAFNYVNYRNNFKSIDYWTDCSIINPAHQEIATLVRYVAGINSSQMCFEFSIPFYASSKSVTFTWPSSIPQTFAQWGYSNPGSKVSYWTNQSRLASNLRQYKPVIMSARSCDACISDAHIWLCEGLKEYQTTGCTLYSHVYMNWGWGPSTIYKPSDNGWYAFSPPFIGAGTAYDNAGMDIIVDITP